MENGAVTLCDQQLAPDVQRESAINRNYLLNQPSYGIAALPFLLKNRLKQANGK